MIRFFLAIIAMFFLPFFAYAAYVFVRRGGKFEANLLEGAPVNWLAVAGAILALGTLVNLVSMDILEYERQNQAPAASEDTEKPGRNP